ncbi:MAG: nucleotide exchange factor GrpE [Candidatus Micrarchaeaceae archaeon]
MSNESQNGSSDPDMEKNANGKKAKEAANGKEGADAAEKQPKEGSDKKTEDYEELKERMLRLAAEFDNYKKRTKEEMNSAKKIGKMELAKSLLPVLDEFELAVIALNGNSRKEEGAGANANNSMAKGIEMVYSNLIDALKKNGISEISAEGTFDPYRHEIIMVKESSKDDGTILEVIKKGYTIDGMLIRPASVIVSRKAAGGNGSNKKIDNPETGK